MRQGEIDGRVGQMDKERFMLAGAQFAQNLQDMFQHVCDGTKDVETHEDRVFVSGILQELIRCCSLTMSESIRVKEHFDDLIDVELRVMMGTTLGDIYSLPEVPESDAA